MKDSFANLTAREQTWIEAYANETIEAAEFAKFQNALKASESLRAALRQYMALDSNLRENLNTSLELSESWQAEPMAAPTSAPMPLWCAIAAAAALAFLAGGALMSLLTPSTPIASAPIPSPVPAALNEPLAEGYAVIHRIQSSTARRAGESLGPGLFRLADGSAQLHFFCGARMTVEGPAELDIQSAWKAVCSRGKLHVQVPPAARGFVVITPGSEIVDLGTEFALRVQNGNTTVEVLDGEIEIHHGEETKRVLNSGQARYLPKARPSEEIEPAKWGAPNLPKLLGQYDTGRREAFDRWLANSAALAADKRLIAYYNFQGMSEGRVPDLAQGGDSERDGAVILADPVGGRWAGMKHALEFRRPGSRARVKLSGKFSAFTFAAWVRVDSLGRQYSALFMSDSYETGEPHWQIENTGRLMMSVMVDDSAPNPNRLGPGKHKLYYSPKIWDPSMSGRWLHLASVFDPAGRQVCHYVDGKRVSREEIPKGMLIDNLHIGNAEIGNWGEPFRRDDPFFAIRNLNGRIDELVLLDAALSADEIQLLWQQSR
jgi:hypothetical protein